MLAFDDSRWENLLGGYRTPFDPRPILSKLESGTSSKEVWDELWEELHHQGDVGEASYAAVPHLVRIYLQRGTDCWNTYDMVAVIDLARERPKNPNVPDWLKQDYFEAIQNLSSAGAVDILRAKDSEDVLAILGVLAIAKGVRVHARFLLEYSAEDLIDLEEQAQDSD